MNGNIEMGGCQGEKRGHTLRAYAYELPTMLSPCPVSDGVLSFKQRKKVPKEAPQGTNGSLTSLARLICGEMTDFSATRIGRFIFPWQRHALTFL